MGLDPFFLLLFLTLPVGAAPNAPLFPIKDAGVEFPVAYENYGTFSNRASGDYRYKIANRAALSKAVGAAIFPNNGSSLSQDSAYRRWKSKNPKALNPWEHVQSGDPQKDFYVWATAQSLGPGTKLLFTGNALAVAGHYRQAHTAYHAVLVHVPREACWSADNTFVWYVAGEALNRIETITNQHPEIGYRLKGSVFKVMNGTDTDLRNDRFVIDPGYWVKRGASKPVSLSSLKVIHQRGLGKVQVVQFENKHWQLRVNGKPMMIRGVSYAPVPIGKSLSSYGNRWMFADDDGNGKPDAPYDSWLDENKNGQQDGNEPATGDFQLMKSMGVNAIRIYRASDGTTYDGSEFNKELLRDMRERYGIYAVMGDFLGAYTKGSGASWDEGTDYTDPVQLETMRQLVKDYVTDHKNEPYVLLWLLGNENLMPADYSGVNATRTKAAGQVEAYLKFVNEVAEMIHLLDPDHPVAVGNLDALKLEEHAKHAPHVDIFGANSYRGNGGFGSLWKNIQQDFDRPVLITEYGCDAFDSRSEGEDEKAQSDYHKGAWEDIYLHRGGGVEEGNAIGGIIFEYMDEWWKSQNGSWDSQDRTKDSPMAFPDSWSSEEFLGILSQGDGNESPLLRRPRQVYSMYKKLWKQ